jgi:gas vesicle protein
MNLKWFALGLGLGAAVGLLCAPKTGFKTRKVREERYTIGDVLHESNQD